MADNQDRTDAARNSLEEAERGKTSGAEKLDRQRAADPATTEAVEQETADGPPGRGLSR